MSIGALIDKGECLGIDMPKLDSKMHAVSKRVINFYEQHRNKYALLPCTMEDTGCHTSAGQPRKHTVASRCFGHMTTSKVPLLQLKVSYLISSQKFLIDLSRGNATAPSFSLS